MSYSAEYRRSYALVIGIDSYQYDVNPPLSTARFGAEAVADVLEQEYAFDEVVRLFDEQATMQAIGDACNDLRAGAEADDRLVIYFAGHGVGLEGTVRTEGWLLAHDSDHTRHHRLVRMTDLVDPNYTQAKHALVILDSCHSGLAVTYEAPRAPAPPRDPRRALRHFLTRRAYQVIASANPLETASDAGLMEGHTPFTGYLLRALQDVEDAVRDPVTGLLTAASAAAYVHSSMAVYYRNRQGPQVGILPGDGGGVLVWRVPGALDALPERLRRALTDDNPDTRYFALGEVERLLADSRLAAAAREVLEDMVVNDPDADVRRRALEALRQVPPEPPVEVSEPEPVPEPEPAPVDDSDAALEWLEELAAQEPEPLAEKPAEEELPDWLKEVEEPAPAEEEAELKPVDDSDAALEWLEELAAQEPEPAAEKPAEEELPDWLKEVEEPAPAAEPITAENVGRVVAQRTLAGHAVMVSSVAWSPDGSRLASSSEDKTVIIWDAMSGASLRTLKGHKKEVWGVAWSPDGRRLASASVDKTVRVWDAASGNRLLTLKGHTDRVCGVAWSPDGSLLASASVDTTVMVWHTRSGELLRTLKGHTDLVGEVVWSPDGRRLASASDDQTVRVWNMARGTRLLTLEGHTGEVWGVAWSPDGSRLASASDDQTVRVWDARSGKLLRTLEGHADAAGSAAWSPDGSLLASASWDKTAIVWDAATGQRLRALEGHGGQVNNVVWSPDGSRLASSSWDKTVIVWGLAG